MGAACRKPGVAPGPSRPSNLSSNRLAESQQFSDQLRESRQFSSDITVVPPTARTPPAAATPPAPDSPVLNTDPSAASAGAAAAAPTATTTANLPPDNPVARARLRLRLLSLEQRFSPLRASQHGCSEAQVAAAPGVCFSGSLRLAEQRPSHAAVADLWPDADAPVALLCFPATPELCVLTIGQGAQRLSVLLSCVTSTRRLASLDALEASWRSVSTLTAGNKSPVFSSMYSIALGDGATVFFQAHGVPFVPSPLDRPKVTVKIHVASDPALFGAISVTNTDFSFVDLGSTGSLVPTEDPKVGAYDLRELPAPFAMPRPVSEDDPRAPGFALATLLRKWRRTAHSHVLQEADADGMGADGDGARPVRRYLVRIKTGGQFGAGTDANIRCAITGTLGESRFFKFDTFGNNFERNDLDEFVIETPDVGEPLLVHLTNDGANLLADWFVRRVVVVDAESGTRTEFPVFAWVNEGRTTVRAGRALLPHRDTAAASAEHRLAERAEMQAKFPWSHSAPGMPGCFGGAHKDLPREEQFTQAKSMDFNLAVAEGYAKMEISRFLSIFDPWDSLSDFSELYKSPSRDVSESWRDDAEYGRQFLAGTHPGELRQTSQEVLDRFAIPDDILPDEATGSVAAELARGRLYHVDYSVLDGVPLHEGRFVTPAFCLLWVNGAGDLVPVAIRLYQDPQRADNVLWRPSDAPYDWMLAKMFVKAADAQVHLLRSHLLVTHLVVEVFAIACYRQMSTSHPIRKLLTPHFRHTLAINSVGRATLIAPGGLADEILAVGGGGHLELLRRAFADFDFTTMSLPTNLRARGVDDPQVLPEYPYRDDGLLLWRAILEYVRSIVRIYYTDGDADVAQDTELQAWVQEIRSEGRLADKGVPNGLATVGELVDFVATVIFSSSVEHAAQNFPQYDLMAYVPNQPVTMLREPPSTRGEADLARVMETLPNRSLSTKQVGLAWILSQYSEEEVFLGEMPQRRFCEPEARLAISEFQHELAHISDLIDERNAKRSTSYPYLKPAAVPASCAT